MSESGVFSLILSCDTNGCTGLKKFLGNDRQSCIIKALDAGWGLEPYNQNHECPHCKREFEKRYQKRLKDNKEGRLMHKHISKDKHIYIKKTQYFEREIDLSVSCPDCGAASEEPCKTKEGYNAYNTHTARQEHRDEVVARRRRVDAEIETRRILREINEEL